MVSVTFNVKDTMSTIIVIKKINNNSGFLANLGLEVIDGPTGYSAVWPDAHSACRAALAEAKQRNLIVAGVLPKVGFPNDYEMPGAVNTELIIDCYPRLRPGRKLPDSIYARLISLDYRPDDYHYFDHNVNGDQFFHQSLYEEVRNQALKVAEACGLTIAKTTRRG